MLRITGPIEIRNDSGKNQKYLNNSDFCPRKMWVDTTSPKLATPKKEEILEIKI